MKTTEKNVGNESQRKPLALISDAKNHQRILRMSTPCNGLSASKTGFDELFFAIDNQDVSSTINVKSTKINL